MPRGGCRLLLTAVLLLTGLLAPKPAGAHPDTFAPVVAAQRDTVVHINTRAQSDPGFGNTMLRPFRDPESGQGMGSGFIVAPDGLIVTSYHVVAGAESVEVVLADERRFDAEIAGLDARTDLALLRIDAEGLPAVRFGPDEAVRVGDWLVAIGNPLGLDYSVTVGILSARGRNIFEDENLAYGEFLQTDAAINPGNSGGPLFDLEGRVIGVNSAISRMGQGIGFAVPSSIAVPVIDQLRRHGRVVRGWMGVRIEQLDPALRADLGLPAGTVGLHVNEVIEGTPAEAAGVRDGDVLLTLATEPLRKVTQLQRQVALSEPGTEVPVTGLRRDGAAGTWQDVAWTLRVGRAPDQPVAGTGNFLHDQVGIQVEPLPDRVRQQAGLSPGEGVLVADVRPGSVGAQVGLAAGDVILEAARRPVGDRAALTRLFQQQPDQRIPLVVRRGDRVLYLVYKPVD